MIDARRLRFPADEWGVSLELGDVPESLEAPTRVEEILQTTADEILMLLPDRGRILITRDRVVVEPVGQTPLDDLDFVLYGWVPRLLRILREEFTLHASAVATDIGAVALMGESGAGKSTTTAGLVARGHPLVVDDVLPVDLVDGRALVHGWDRPVHLDDVAAEALQLTSRSRLATAEDPKQQVELSLRDEERIPLALAVELRRDPSVHAVSVDVLHQIARLQAVLRHSNAVGLSDADGRAPAFFQWSTGVAAAVPTVRIRRPSTGWHLDEVLDEIESLVAQIVRSGTIDTHDPVRPGGGQ